MDFSSFNVSDCAVLMLLMLDLDEFVVELECSRKVTTDW